MYTEFYLVQLVNNRMSRIGKLTEMTFIYNEQTKN